MRWSRWLVLGLLLAILPVQLVAAHPKIIRTDPVADAQLRTPPTQVQIEFNEAIEQSFAGLQVLNAQGQPVDNGDGGRSTTNPAVLSVSLPALPPGIYTVIWQVVGSDGHHVKGFYAFGVLGQANLPIQPTVSGALPDPQIVPTVGLVPATAPTPAEQPELPIGWGALLRACMLLGSLIAIGGWAFLGMILGPFRTTHQDLYRIAILRIRRLLIAGLVVTLLAIPAFLVIQTSSIANRVDLPSLWLTLTATRLGQALLVRALIAGVLLILVLFGKRPDRYQIPALILGSGMLLTFSLSGHASAEALPLVPIMLDWLHLAATTLWIGGMIAFVLVLPQLSAVIGPAIARFSNMALACVILLTASGVYAATLHLTTFSDLWTSDYGRTLTAKLVLFGIAIAIGAYHILIVRPTTLTRIAQAATAITDWQRRFQVSLRVEAVVAMLIIGLVGLLTSLPLPDSQPVVATPTIAPLASAATEVPLPSRTPAPIVPFVGEQAAADLRVALRVEPAGLGTNTLQVTVMDANGQPRDVQRVQMSLEMTTMDMGETMVIAEPDGNGMYQVKNQWLSMVGEWHVQVLVRRSDADDVTVTFIVPIADSR